MSVAFGHVDPDLDHRRRDEDAASRRALKRRIAAVARGRVQAAVDEVDAQRRRAAARERSADSVAARRSVFSDSSTSG